MMGSGIPNNQSKAPFPSPMLCSSVVANDKDQSRSTVRCSNHLMCLKLFTCGGLGFWALIDQLLIGMGKMRDVDGNSLNYDL